MADARRRAGGDHVARLERDRPRREGHDGPNVEHHLGRARVLPGIAVHRRAETERLRIAQLVGGDDCRAHRREAVGPLGPQPLAVLSLEVAHRHVVEDRVPEDGLKGVEGLARDALRPITTASSHSRSSCSVAAGRRSCAWVGDGVCELAEQDRVSGRLDALLAAMVVVVQADADDLAGAPNGCEKLDLVGLVRLCRRPEVLDVGDCDPARQHLADVGRPEDRGQVVDRPARRLDAELDPDPRGSTCPAARGRDREVRAR